MNSEDNSENKYGDISMESDYIDGSNEGDDNDGDSNDSRSGNYPLVSDHDPFLSHEANIEDIDLLYGNETALR